MPNTPTSFIPKQGPAKRTSQTASRHVHLLMVISYVSFIASLIASAGVFFYERYLDQQLTAQVESLNTEINGFSDADMERVREFNVRLEQTRGLLDKSVSLSSVFLAIEEATLKSVSIDELTIKKSSDSEVELAAKIATDTFDSSLFQRGVFERNDIIEAVEVEDLTIVKAGEEGAETSGVTFTAKLLVPSESIRVTAETFTTPETDDGTSSSTEAFTSGSSSTTDSTVSNTQSL